MDANEIRNAVDTILAEAGIVYTVSHCGEDVETTGSSKWRHDKWKAVFKGTSGTESFEYHTGIGLRKAKISPVAAAGKPGTLHREKWERKNVIPVAPRAADVLHCLLSDADSASAPFAEWCDDLGYDEDSRKALATYLACQDEGRRLSNVIPRGVRMKIAELVREL